MDMFVKHGNAGAPHFGWDKGEGWEVSLASRRTDPSGISLRLKFNDEWGLIC